MLRMSNPRNNRINPRIPLPYHRPMHLLPHRRAMLQMITPRRIQRIIIPRLGFHLRDRPCSVLAEPKLPISNVVETRSQVPVKTFVWDPGEAEKLEVTAC